MSLLPPPPASWLKVNTRNESTVDAWPSIGARPTPNMAGTSGDESAAESEQPRVAFYGATTGRGRQKASLPVLTPL